MIIFLIILAYLIIGFLEIVPLVKKHKNKELILYCSIFSISLIMSILLGFGVEIPSPAKYIEKVVLMVVGEK
ncbi:MAG: hypothetical protein N4A48_13960 [Tepidibacter sp.]|jgi:LytS/YehU family sensor histidine kinase|uniref:hypothetical protein n=1 Tax=Tepidibacter sp. TaxID=2529387 RepID=UPI0025EC8DEB|nr:hypothetical protein [Tepidibacter sp.]MCT4509834.1 hypothetical protein [Tepidibacter sp.]